MSVGGLYGTARDHWRILLLAVFLVTSGVALAPGGDADGLTSLEYGLELSGGTQVQAPFVGMTAENVAYGDARPVEVERTVATELEIAQTDVQARPGLGAFEVYSDDVTREEVAAALRAAGLDVQASDVRDGVTRPTRETAKQVIETKIHESPDIPGGQVQLINTPGGDWFIRIEVPNADRERVLELVRDRGLVEVVAVYPVEGNNSTTYRSERMFTQENLQTGPADEDEQGRTFVRVTLTEEAAADFASDMRALGFVDESQGVGQCNWGPSEEEQPENPGYCLVTYKDGEKVYAASMGDGLAELIRNGEFRGSFRMLTTSMDEARELKIALEAGSLPTDVDVEDEGTTLFIQPSLAAEFRLYSLITGVVAAVAVGLVIFHRYGKARVAVPMLLTALAEVFILLGFAASIHLPLDLAHIAGFIAVIGTGVDDLVIIADEVLHRGDVSTRRVFQNRFRKAFWIIGAAAATTIIAMSPLMILSLGDLSGFAMVTIVGVLIGVLITRPAYGDVLRVLMTRERP